MEVQKKSSTARRILGWLKYLFNALASIFALGSFVSPFLHFVTPGLSLIAPAAYAFESSRRLLWTGIRNTRRERIGEHRVRASIPQGHRPEGSTHRTEESRTV
ncbi:hypothetical protein EDB89DRAFT_2235757 [Lactarius sanguifluus]|nr:hypothetical protein EDB89DRAFT_2235757 [Lactarius sanguifluus]